MEKPVASSKSQPWYRRYPAAQFLVTLALVLISSPVTEEYGGSGELAEAARLSVVLLAGLWALGGRRKALIFGLLLVTPALVANWLNHWRPALVPDWTFLVPAVLFVLFLISQLLRFILRAPHVNSEVLCAGISGYVVMGLLWSLAYILVAQLSPGAFVFTAGPASGQVMKGFTALYYSFITLSTVGYGDIIPVSGAARMLAMVEATVGIFYTTILLARLVTLYSSTPPPAGPEDKTGL